MSDATARATHPLAAPPGRLSRVRCAHCAMPVRGSQDPCWSCGLDPTSAPEAVGPRPQASATGPPPPASRRGRRIVGSVVLGLVLAAVACALTVLVPADGNEGVRGIAARLRGVTWAQADLRGASAAFPVEPVRQDLAPGLEGARSGERLVAEQAGLRAELVVADVGDVGKLLDGAAMAERLVSGYATATSGQVVRRTPLYLDGSPGLDAVVEGGGTTVRIRAIVSGTTGYLMALAGPVEAFVRFTESFRAPAQP